MHNVLVQALVAGLPSCQIGPRLLGVIESFYYWRKTRQTFFMGGIAVDLLSSSLVLIRALITELEKKA